MGSSYSIPTQEEYQKTLSFEKCSQKTFRYRMNKFTQVCKNKKFSFKDNSARQAVVSFMLMIFSDIVYSYDISQISSFLIQTMINELQEPSITNERIQSFLKTLPESEKVLWTLSDKSFDMTFKIFINIPHIADYF